MIGFPIFRLPPGAADYKLKYAIEGFACGLENPVPLAEVGVDGAGGVGFTNGITRTLWLLVHRAAAFPVECRTACSSSLNILAGATVCRPRTVQELTWSDEIPLLSGPATLHA